MNKVQHVQKHRGNRNRAVDPCPLLLCALDYHRAVLQVDAIGCERERLRDPASGMGECCAERPHLAFGFISGLQEGLLFDRRQVLAVSAVVIEVSHAADLSRLPTLGGFDSPTSRESTAE